MRAKIEWLPVGHIAHGYRRVFALYEQDCLRHVIQVAPLAYETVYRVREMAGSEGVDDPSLWWGLSAIAALVTNGTLLGPANPETADDGYLQIRPQVPGAEELLPLPIYERIRAAGCFEFAC